ncbi:BREX protein BrxB domain-containing protein [Thiocapsa sp.]|uniref:BREX protein BrxB domain-containing protein n=1 Tax=Thiocapsa sp. TaxID=2024551 RepID=UPI00359471D9
MSSLESSFAELRSRLGAVDRLNPTSADPLFPFVHLPEETAELMRALPRWRTRLEEDGWRVHIQSVAEIMWQVIDASGRWEDWLEEEATCSTDEVIGAVRNALSTKTSALGSGLAPAILELVSHQEPNRLLLLTDAALLHPFFRVRAVEALVHDRVACPTVVFYPGTKVGQFGLRFLGFYAEDPHYLHSGIIGGEV